MSKMVGVYDTTSRKHVSCCKHGCKLCRFYNAVHILLYYTSHRLTQANCNDGVRAHLATPPPSPPQPNKKREEKRKRKKKLKKRGGGGGVEGGGGVKRSLHKFMMQSVYRERQLLPVLHFTLFIVKRFVLVCCKTGGLEIPIINMIMITDFENFLTASGGQNFTLDFFPLLLSVILVHPGIIVMVTRKNPALIITTIVTIRTTAMKKEKQKKRKERKNNNNKKKK